MSPLRNDKFALSFEDKSGMERIDAIESRRLTQLGLRTNSCLCIMTRPDKLHMGADFPEHSREGTQGCDPDAQIDPTMIANKLLRLHRPLLDKQLHMLINNVNISKLSQ